MSLSRIADISISLAERPIALEGFGIPLVAAILTAGQDTAWDTEHGASVDVIEVTPSNWQTSLTALGVTSSEDLYVGLNDLFSQDEQPETVLIGRRATAVAQVVQIDIDGTTDGTFTVTINGADYAFAASGNTAAEIRDGLIAAITADQDSDNDGAADIAAAIVDADSHSVTSSVAGVPFTYSASHSTTPADIAISQTTASVGLVEDIAAWRAERDDWYFLLETSRLSGNIRAAAEAIEALTKFFVAQSSDANAQTSSTENIGTRLGPVGLNLDRTMLWYSANDDQFVDFAIVGKMAPKQPGRASWANQSLRSVTGTEPTSETQLEAKRFNWLETFTAANFAMTQGGWMCSGQWADLIRLRDWVRNLMQIDLIQLLRDNDKIPYTNGGGDLLGGSVEGSLEKAAAPDVAGVDGSTIAVTTPTVAEQGATNRGNRHFPNIGFGATLTGAVHTLSVSGSLSP